MSAPRVPAPAGPHLLKVKEVAERLNVTVRTVQSWIQLGRLTPIRLSPKVLRISEDDVKAFIDRSTALAPTLRS